MTIVRITVLDIEPVEEAPVDNLPEAIASLNNYHNKETN